MMQIPIQGPCYPHGRRIDATLHKTHRRAASASTSPPYPYSTTTQYLSLTREAPMATENSVHALAEQWLQLDKVFLRLIRSFRARAS
jgi:hypothetical protein